MSNHLALETSPYLQQHAENPVDWRPWGEEALTLAREQDKPILLSIGYSACHWCHVMAHESFEDPDVAALMNRLFVNIKVDREERPDIDQIYQNAHHMLTRRSGGWPLTMFLMPDQTPFVGGTYFPKTARHGLPGFRELLARVDELYRTRRTDIEQQNASLLQALAHAVPAASEKHTLGDAPLHAAVRELARSFDPRDGGLGPAPKFPHPYAFDFLLRRFAAGDSGALEMVTVTLTHMAEGGIYDQLGGGFCRYSVDAQWTIPHFEKMLYDNGPLLALYTDAWRATSEPLFARVVEQTAGWVMREMQSPTGGYYSSLDADSEHEEGKFYVWSVEEIRGLLSAEEFEVVEPHYGLDRTPNFEDKYWHLRVTKPLRFVATRTGQSSAQCQSLLDIARAKLLAAREVRVRPDRDEKILTSWNALMIRGMARAARQFARADWLASAQRAADFLRATMWRDQRLFATHKDARTHLNAYLDDHAFLLDALIELMQAQLRAEDLEFARSLADALLQRFEDQEAGGFFFTSHDHERLIQRAKPGHDNATPSGNGIAAFALQRLGHLLGELRYLASAERTMHLFWPHFSAYPSGFASLLNALAEHLVPPRSVLLRGPSLALAPWRDLMREAYRPQLISIAMPNGVRGLPPTFAPSDSDMVNALVCQGVTCLSPITDRAELRRVLDDAGNG
jgi:uncharacterized protein YyaL (SSP411 family)